MSTSSPTSSAAPAGSGALLTAPSSSNPNANSPNVQSSPVSPSINSASPLTSSSSSSTSIKDARRPSGDIILPPAVSMPPLGDSTSSFPHSVQSARGPPKLAAPTTGEDLGPATAKAASSTPAATSRVTLAPPSTHRRAQTAMSPSDLSTFDWPPPSNQRGTSGSSTGGNSTNSGNGYSSVSPAPILHSFPPSASIYMQSLLTKKGRNLGFGLGFWRTTRLYMLTDTALSWTDKSGKNVKGAHLVESFKSVVRLPSRRWPNRCFTLRFEDDKVYHLRAPTVSDCNDWIDALSKAIVNASKLKARWQFMRDNAQMQQMAQMAQLGVQAQFGQLSPQQQQAYQQQIALLQQQQQLDLLGMMQMPVPAQDAVMSPLQVAQVQNMQMAQYAGYPVPLTYVPAPVLSHFNEDAVDSTSGVAPMQRLKSRSRSIGKDGGSLTRTDSKSKGALPIGLVPPSGDVGCASDAEADDGAGTTDEEDVGSADDGAASASGEEDNEYYDDSDEYYPSSMIHPFPYDPFTAAAAAAAHQAAAFAWHQSQSNLLYDPSTGASSSALIAPASATSASPQPPAATEEQQALNSKKKKIGWMSWMFTIISGVILAIGNEAHTLKEIRHNWIGEEISTNTSMNGTSVNGSSTTGVVVTALGSSGQSFSPSLIVFLLSLSLTVFMFLRLKKHKKRCKTRQQEKKKADAAQSQSAAALGRPPTLAESNAAQAKWKEESKLLQQELNQTTQIMSMLAGSAAVTVACAAYIYRS